MKFCDIDLVTLSIGVASFTGAWIEIGANIMARQKKSVASFTGAWIEILWLSPERNLLQVASFTGAWIEIVVTVL